MTLIALSYWDIAFAASLLVINAGLSIFLQLGVHRQLIISAVRMTVQLTLIGFVLLRLFALVSPLWTAVVAMIMVAFAGYEIMSRLERRFYGGWAFGLGAGPMLFAAGLVTVFTLTTQINADPWYDPRFSLPLFGMILGNTMTGISLGLNTLISNTLRERNAIEAQIALGRTATQALGPVVRQAMRSGFIPIINSMAASGIVSLPGMMTGQILAGVEPGEAVKFQILIMFLIGGATGIGVTLAVLSAAYRLTDQRHRLRLDRLTTE